MFITNSHRRYTRDGQQKASGQFLCVFCHNQHSWEEQNNHPHHELSGQAFDVATGDGFTIQRKCSCTDYQYYSLKYCPVHCGEYKTMPSSMGRTLYGFVCKVSMSQCGHFMMGIARALPVQGKDYKYYVCSGTYGSDGLPGDYEALTESARAKLVKLPAELATKFWAGGGHNCAGNEAGVMRDWAIATFKIRKSKGGK